MDVSGSFLELACARVALVPVGGAISESRFEELVCILNSCREVPLNALPRRAALSRSQVPIGSSTYSSMPVSLREAMQGNNSPILARSRSAGRDFTRLGRRAANSSPNLEIPSNMKDTSNDTKDASGESSEDLTERSQTVSAETSPPAPVTGVNQSAIVSDRVTLLDPKRLGESNLVANVSQRDQLRLKPSGGDLDLSSSEVDSSFRMRFEVVRRDSRGALLLKSPSEWDEFHSSRTWGVIGICDNINSDATEKDTRMTNAYGDFSNLLERFKHAPIRRLMVLSSADTSRAAPPVLFQEPNSFITDSRPQVPFSVGYIPGSQSYNEMKLEIRAQVTHFAGLLIATIDRDCWKRRESPQSELFLSPIDERHSADRQSKLAKRRAGRLDKLLADSLLLMGSPREALVKYNSAVERAKASSDRLWLAGAMEGWSAAHVLTHIGSGGRVDDADLTDMLVEQYNEIYKLYQKKRAAEPEAGAALRLAEYLGTWTSRRKDALHAAQHAAAVGESLKTQKRASLWEALARFSERMGCRRKAALFLYRLGHFNASQSSWSSAVELMLASEGQLTQRGTKPWASLNRQILQMAARYAEEANDSSTAARLWVEALVASPYSKWSTETDETIMTALQRTQVPSFLPGSSKIIDVEDVDPMNLHGSSFTQIQAHEGSSHTEPVMESGPFIYNPFEAKKKAKAAAVARQTVNWVCGEPAQVSLTLRNRVGTKISFELISVLFGLEDEENVFRAFSSTGDSSSDEQILVSSKKHSTNVREALETSSCLVKTISESVQVDPGVAVMKSVTVVPKRPSRVIIRGLLIRLFGGALVIVTSQNTSDLGGIVVNVMPELPILSLTCPSSGLASADTFCGRRAPISVLDGETREVKVVIRNAGRDRISCISARMDVSDPNHISTHAEGLGDADLLQALEQPGTTHSVVLTFRRDPYWTKSSEQQISSSHYSEGSSIVTLTVQYEGSNALGIVRESHTSLKVVSEPVIQVDRVRQIRCGEGAGVVQHSGSLLAVEVSNLGSVPADVTLSQHGHDEDLEVDRAIHPGEDKHCSPHRRCLLESGASVRLVQQIGTPLAPADNAGKLKRELHELNGTSPASRCRLRWTLPAFGRSGFLDIHPLRRLEPSLESIPSCDNLGDRSPQIYLIPRDLHGRELAVQSMETRSFCSIPVDTFITIVVRLRLDSSILKTQCELDSSVESVVATPVRGHHCVSLAGNCRRVPVSNLRQSGEFLEHQFRMRVLSVGTFCIRVSLQASDKSRNEISDENGFDGAHLEPANSIHGGRDEQLSAAEQDVNSQQRRTSIKRVANPAEETGEYSGSDLRQLNLNPSLHVIRPTTEDMYRSDNRSPLSNLLATSFLTLRAVSSNGK